MNKFMYIDMFRNQNPKQIEKNQKDYVERINDDNDLSESDKSFLLNYIGR